MIFTAQQTRIAYKKLPPDIQELVMDTATTDLVSNALKETGLKGDQADLADSEILYTLYCLQTLDEAIINITKLTGKNITELSKLKSVVQTEVLDKYKIDINDFIKLNKTELTKTSPAFTSVPSFKPTVPEIAPEIHPTIQPNQPARVIPHVEQSVPTLHQTPTPPFQKPAPVPKPEAPKPEVKLPDYRYPKGTDPYREPV